MTATAKFPNTLFAFLLAVLPCAARAGGDDIVQALRGADWPTADQLAGAYADPVARKLVQFVRLSHPDGGSAAEIAGFIAANPDWPGQSTLLKRRDEALAADPAAEDAAALCNARPAVPAPRSGPALARCADAEATLGHVDDATASARTAWVAGFPDADSEARFLQRWQAVLTPADEMQRFRVMLAANQAGAATQIGRLPKASQPLARASLAEHANSPDAAGLIAALPTAQRQDPGLVLDQLRNLRRANQDDAALALWDAQGFAAERLAGAPLADAFWAERASLARKRLTAGDNQGAYRLADDTGQTATEAQADAAFLAGFIALRRLQQPALAGPHFRALASSTAAISLARAHYWLARTAAAAQDDATARAEYARAAAWPTTYYGQLALLAAGSDGAALATRIDALADPAWSDTEALDFAGRELPRAASMLVAWGDPARARGFLGQIASLAADSATRSLDAHFALGLDLPDQAVGAARKAGRDGTMLPQAGWPIAADPPGGALPEAVALGIIRQESSFDTGAISPSGARGLMQLMPATALQVGRQLGAVIPTGSLNTDPAANMRLGSAYLAGLVERFGGCLPLAIAAYNAGPSRVDQWLGDNGDPRSGGAAMPPLAMIDWIELIPFAETRNYVQRVVENIVIYRAKRHETLPHPLGT